MHADLTKVRQSLFNLLSNASKFTENGPCRAATSTARTIEGQDWIAFRVTDTGIGMTPEQVSQPLRAVHPGGRSTTRKFGGTGLGLAITRRFCRMMGGDVTVRERARQGIDVHDPPAAGGTEPATPAGAEPRDAAKSRSARSDGRHGAGDRRRSGGARPDEAVPGARRLPTGGRRTAARRGCGWPASSIRASSRWTS